MSTWKEYLHILPWQQRKQSLGNHPLTTAIKRDLQPPRQIDDQIISSTVSELMSMFWTNQPLPTKRYSHAEGHILFGSALHLRSICHFVAHAGKRGAPERNRTGGYHWAAGSPTAQASLCRQLRNLPGQGVPSPGRID